MTYNTRSIMLTLYLHTPCSMVEAYLAHTVLVGSIIEDVLRSAGAGGGGGSSSSTMGGASGSGKAGAAAGAASWRRELAAALQAVVDVATGRWAKLMAARSDVHRCVGRVYAGSKYQPKLNQTKPN